MKKLTPKMTITAVLVVMSIILSCSSSRTALNCPEIIQSKTYPRASSKLNKPDKRFFAYSQNKNNKNLNVKNLSASRKRNSSTFPITVTDSNLEKNNSAISGLGEIVPIYSEENTQTLSASYDNSDILEQSIHIPENKPVVTYPIIELNKTSEGGLKETILPATNKSVAIPASETTNPKPNAIISQEIEPQTEGLGLAGFVSGAVGLFVGALPLGLVATIFGAISLGKIKKNPSKFKGRGFAIASLTLGIIDLVFGLIIIALIL